LASSTDGSLLRWDIPVSTASSNVEFGTIQFKVTFDAGNTSTVQWPRLTSMEAHAQMNQKFRSQDLLLKCTDEDSQAQHRALRGANQIDNVQTLGLTAVPVEFLDGYTNRDPGKYDTYDVVVDDFRIILDRPGEGVAWVRLVGVA
jgi:hypothetical protein